MIALWHPNDNRPKVSVCHGLELISLRILTSTKLRSWSCLTKEHLQNMSGSGNKRNPSAALEPSLWSRSYLKISQLYDFVTNT